LTRILVRRSVLCGGLDRQNLIDVLREAYTRNGCDGLFLPAVDNLGVRLPINALVRTLRHQAELRFVVVDGAQAIGHIPLTLTDCHCDVFLAGCHKWLRAYKPLGMLFCGSSPSAVDVDPMVHTSVAKRRLDDPLLQFTMQLERRQLSRYGETVSLLPLLTCQAAVRDALGDSGQTTATLAARLQMADRLVAVAQRHNWRPIRPEASMRTGICLLQKRDRPPTRVSADQLRQQFHDAGVAVTTYPNGLVRFSMPDSDLSMSDESVLTHALARCAASRVRPKSTSAAL
jgi:hypothetical protein